MTEPIIPVRKGGRVDGLWRQVVDVLEPVTLVNVDAPSRDAEVFATEVGLELVSLSDIDRRSRAQFCAHPAHVRHDAIGSRTEPSVIPAANGPLWQVVAAGDLTPERETDYNSREPLVGRVRAEDEVARAQLRGNTALDRTTDQLPINSGSASGSHGTAVLWVMNPNGYADSVYFWNLRALRQLGFGDRPFVVIPARGVEDWLDFERQFSELLRRRIASEPDVTVCSITVDRRRLEEVAKHLGLQDVGERWQQTIRFPEPDERKPPFTCTINIDPIVELLGERSYGAIATARVLTGGTVTHLDVANPVKGSRGRTLARVGANELDALPKTETVAKSIVQHARWVGRSLEIATDLRPDYSFELTIPTLEEAAWRSLRVRFPEAALSDKGRLGEAVERTRGTAVLTDRDVLAVIRFITTPRSNAAADLLERLVRDGHDPSVAEDAASRVAGRGERRFVSVTDLRGVLGPDDSTLKARALRAAERLADSGYSERGFVIRCDVCAITSFVPLSLISGQANCPACGTAQQFRAEPSPLLHYRLDGLVDRASDNGVIAHLAVRRSLLGDSTTGFLAPGVLLKDEADSELDLFGVVNGELVAGEVKQSAAGFSTEQLRFDIEKSERAGAAVHVVGSSEELTDKIISEAYDLSTAAGLSLTVVTPAGVRKIRERPE